VYIICWLIFRTGYGGFLTTWNTLVCNVCKYRETVISFSLYFVRSSSLHDRGKALVH